MLTAISMNNLKVPREQQCTQSQSWHSAAELPLGKLTVQVQEMGNL
jgi:hypothetical protein